MDTDIRLLIIDDSVFFKSLLQIKLANEKDVTFLNEDVNINYFFEDITRLQPNVVLLNLDIKSGNTESILKFLVTLDVKVIIISSNELSHLDILKMGAYSFIHISDVRDKAKFNNFYTELLNILRNESVKPLRKAAHFQKMKRQTYYLDENRNKDSLIVIGASTGGTEAILNVVRDLPKNTNPILVVQHMPDNFVDMYVKRAAKECLMKVEKASHLTRLEEGLILIAPGDLQMVLCKDIKGFYVECTNSGKFNGHAPSVDILFNSCAKINTKSIMGILLTGMGADGSFGLLNMKNAGQYTVIQDEQTCVIYGMPMMAHKIGAECKQLSVYEISNEIICFLNNN